MQWKMALHPRCGMREHNYSFHQRRKWQEVEFSIGNDHQIPLVPIILNGREEFH